MEYLLHVLRNFFVNIFAGHLPAKMKDYHRKYRSLATTYLSYSTDGVYLLANLGGDHIYLFDTITAEIPREYTTPIKYNSQPQKGNIDYCTMICLPHKGKFDYWF